MDFLKEIFFFFLRNFKSGALSKKITSSNKIHNFPVFYDIVLLVQWFSFFFFKVAISIELYQKYTGKQAAQI